MRAVRRKHVVLAAIVAVVPVAIVAGLAVLWVGAQGPRGAHGLGGTNVTERDLSPRDQRSLIDAFSPVPTPPEATDVRLRYQRFQDWYFEASFTLPPEQLARFVGQLQSSPEPDRYVGRQVGAYRGSVYVDPPSGRVTIRHVST